MFNSRRLHVMTGEHYRETATAPAYDLVLAVSRRHLRAPPAIHWGCAAPARRQDGGFALMALVSDYMQYPTGSLFSECQGFASPQLVAMASNRAMSRGAPKWRRYREPACLGDCMSYCCCTII